MTWHVAHVLMVFQPQEPIQQPLFCWENMLLIEAEDEDDVWAMAEARANAVDVSEDYYLSSPYAVPGKWVLAGIRKIVLVRHDTHSDRLMSGDELSYNTLFIADDTQIQKFVNGEPCTVQYASDLPE